MAPTLHFSGTTSIFMSIVSHAIYLCIFGSDVSIGGSPHLVPVIQK